MKYTELFENRFIISKSKYQAKWNSNCIAKISQFTYISHFQLSALLLSYEPFPANNSNW